MQELQGLRPLKSLEELVEFKWKLAILVVCGFFAPHTGGFSDLTN